MNIPDSRQRAVPHFLVWGTEDPLIGVENVEAYADALMAAGQDRVFLPVEGAGHAFYDWGPERGIRENFTLYGVPQIGEMLRFFDNYL